MKVIENISLYEKLNYQYLIIIKEGSELNPL